MRAEGGIVSSNVQSLASFVWSIAEILRGDFKQSEYGKVILPFVVMRRLDCILEARKTPFSRPQKRLARRRRRRNPRHDPVRRGRRGNIKVYNLSRFTFAS